MPRIVSSAITRAEYDPRRRILSLWWEGSGRGYDYLDVPAEVYHAFLAAESQGRFANKVIKPRYEMVKR